MGKERGYLLYDEVNDILPAEVHSSEEIDDLLSTFEPNGIDIYEDAATAKAARATLEITKHADAEPKEVFDGEESDFEPTPCTLEKTTSTSRLHLLASATIRLH